MVFGRRCRQRPGVNLLGSCCRLLVTPSVMQVNLGIDSVPPNGVDGRGEVFWGEDGLQGYVKGA